MRMHISPYFIRNIYSKQITIPLKEGIFLYTIDISFRAIFIFNRRVLLKARRLTLNDHLLSTIIFFRRLLLLDDHLINTLINALISVKLCLEKYAKPFYSLHTPLKLIYSYIQTKA